MDVLRLGIIGIGNQGCNYLKAYSKGGLREIEITAVADINPERFTAAKKFIPDIACFNSGEELIASDLCDAVVIATPHYFHPTYAIKAMEAGIHALSEKPAGVYTKQVREAIDFSKTVDVTYAMMFNQRPTGAYKKIRDMVQSGQYGELRRVSWIITDWFRTQQYYDSGSWRATWAGEGGGVMLNQCPHQLDLWQWICGMPNKIRATCHEGKWHNIEVEDDVTIYAEYPNGATGTFITTTGDYPGSNRLEITLDKARIIHEFDPIQDKFTARLCVLEMPSREFSDTADGGFSTPEIEWQDIDVPESNAIVDPVVNAFAAHILHGEPLIAEGAEGINGLTISNAAFLSSWLDKTIEIPFDEDLYLELLNKKIENSKYVKVTREQFVEDMNATYGSRGTKTK